MTVYSRLLAAGSFTGPAVVPVYTVPEGQTVVVRDIIMYTTGGGLPNMGARANSGLASVHIAAWVGVTANTVYHSDLRQVLNEGDTISININAASLVEYRVSGYVFDA